MFHSKEPGAAFMNGHFKIVQKIPHYRTDTIKANAQHQLNVRYCNRNAPEGIIESGKWLIGQPTLVCPENGSQ
jgi:hypothetical protein